MVRPGEHLEIRQGFEFVRANQGAHRVTTMCRVLGVSKSGFYAWCSRPPSQRARDDERLVVAIRRSHAESDGTYGAPRVLRDLRERDMRVGCKRIARLMKKANLRGVCRRKGFRTTVRDDNQRPSPDLVHRDFTAQGPNQLWVADITYIPTHAGFLFLAVVLDVWSRRIVGWAMATHLRTELVLEAMQMAIAQRQPSNVVHHSDQGCQYTSFAFGSRCRDAGIRPSMGTVGDCFDNAMCESFFASLECELLDRYVFHTQAEAKMYVFKYIEGFYNPRRRHSSLDYLSPMNYESKNWPGTVTAN